MKKEVEEKQIEDKKSENEEIVEVKKSVNKVLLCLISLVCLIGIYIVVTKIGESKDNKKFASEYTNVTEDNVFVYRTASEIIDILEGGTGVVFFGFPECKWCQAYVPILNEVAKQKEVEEIYYLNILKDRKENTKEYQRIVELLSDVLDTDSEGKTRVFVPEVIVVVDGKVLGHNNDTSLINDSSIIPDNYWTTEKKEELENSLTVMFSKLNTCINCNE